jgi:MOSC domain-containing protein YiiM
MFGENLTVAGLDETRVHVGDRFRAGTAELIATEPRLPCFKLGLRFKRATIVRRFAASGRCGVYFAVARAGLLAPGDPLELLAHDAQAVSIHELFEIALAGAVAPARLERALASAGLPERWRVRLQRRLRE